MPAGSLSVDAIPYNATRPEHVVSIYHFTSASVGPFGGRLAWNSSLEGVLAAAGNASSGGGGGGGGTAAGAPADPSDFFLRFRYCPTTIQPSCESNGSAVPNPFVGPDSGAGGGASVLQQGGSDAERQAAADDGSEGGGPCAAPVPLPGSASPAQCAAARRLLQCSESLLFLTELKDARLAPANVTAEVAPAGAAAQQAVTGAPAGEAPGGPPAFAVRLSSDAVALFVSVEAEGQPGQFNGSARLLLPWQPQTLLFFPAAQPGGGGPGSAGSASAGSTPQAEPGGPWMAAAYASPAAEQTPAAEHTPAAEQAATADPPGAAPNVSVYWLQQALAELQPPEGQGQAASSAGAGAARPSPLALLVMAALCALWLQRLPPSHSFESHEQTCMRHTRMG